MVRLVEITERNIYDYTQLMVNEEQEIYCEDVRSALAWGYVYRDRGARVWGIEADGAAAGLAMVKDPASPMDEEDCYDLFELLVDQRFQRRGIGAEALRLILEFLRAERRYEGVQAIVNVCSDAALRLLERAGFEELDNLDEVFEDILVKLVLKL